MEPLEKLQFSNNVFIAEEGLTMFRIFSNFSLANLFT
jgi:hypothetical protein